jgi:hypothetical protein
MNDLFRRYFPIMVNIDRETRAKGLKENFPLLWQHALTVDRRLNPDNLPVGANTVATSLLTQFLEDGATTILTHRLAPLRAFTTDFRTDSFKPLATGQLKFVTAGTTVGVNTSNFESGDSVVANVPVSVSHYSAPFHVSDSELNSGLRMQDLMERNAQALADSLIGVALTPVQVANFPTPIVRSSASFSWSDMQVAWGSIKKSPIKNAVLDGEWLSKLVNVPTFVQRTGDGTAETAETGWKAFGWDSIFLNTNWSGTPAGDHIVGLFANPQAVVCLAGLPLAEPFLADVRTLSRRNFELPGLKLNVSLYSWFSLSSRTWWASYDCMFGSALCDTTAATLLTSQ